MKEALGYEPVPGSKDFTWERYCEVAKWIDENVSEDEVKIRQRTYGPGT